MCTYLRLIASLKAKGDLAEVMIAADLIRRGYRVAIPYGEDWNFDLILCRDERLERVQCKYTCSDGTFVIARAQSHSLTNGKVRATKRYTAAMIDWLAVYDATTERCYYVPAKELGEGMSSLRLRLTAARNNQQRRIRPAAAYLEI
jgi:hypothetical protein